MNDDSVFVFGEFRFLPRQQLLVHAGRPVKLGSRAMDILHLLVKNAGELVSHGSLEQFVWPHTFVHPSNLKVHIHSLRRALGENSDGSSYIASVPGRGYRFIPAVAIEAAEPATMAQELTPSIQILPPPRGLIGREYEVERAADLLAQRSLVTLVGPGGVGKTSIAIAVAHRLQREFPDGIYFVDFAAANQSSVVPNILAAACGLRGNPPDTVVALIEYLASRRTLIVMDSCEHVLTSVALIAMRFQEAGIPIRLLATSIESLRLSREAVQLIEPLAYPSSSTVQALNDAMAYSSVELLATRALEWADYQLTDEDLPAVIALCEKLGGLPLAIELAAAKLDRYTPAALLESLDQRFNLLRNDDPAVHRRHRALWATLDWSYQLLSPEEATIFRLLSVFSAPFTQEEVAIMAQVVRYNPYQTTLALGGLVAKSLIAAELDVDILRYRLLDCARAYAADKLSQEPSADEIHRHFAQLMLTMLERFSRERTLLIDGNASLIQNLSNFKRRLSDLREALHWCLGAGNDPVLGIRLAVAAMPLWNELSLMAEESFYVQRALEHCVSSGCDVSQRAILVFSTAWSHTQDRKLLPEYDPVWMEAIFLAERTDDANQRLRALAGWASHQLLSGRYHEALHSLSEYRQLAEVHEGGVAVLDGERLLAMIEIYLGKLVPAREKLERQSRVFANGDPRSKVPRYQVEPYALVQNLMSLVTCLMGFPDRAAVMAAEAVETTGRTEHSVAQSYVLTTGALPIAFWNGDSDCFQRYVEKLGANLSIECMAIWVPMYRFFRALGLHASGQTDATDEMRSAIDQMLSSGFLMNVPMHLGLMADALLQNGSHGDAERTVSEALSLIERSGEVWCIPELLRVRAKVSEIHGQQQRAEEILREAMARAAEMSARSLELRVASELAALLIKQGRESAAAALLGPIYESFSEGHGTKDMRLASALLGTARASRE
ncbi:MAG TPA: winged helix-turn-helix domain-containing protein [Steroidobacter sp.]